MYAPTLSSQLNIVEACSKLCRQAQLASLRGDVAALVSEASPCFLVVGFGQGCSFESKELRVLGFGQSVRLLFKSVLRV